jgi:hypothetical protein
MTARPTATVKNCRRSAKNIIFEIAYINAVN